LNLPFLSSLGDENRVVCHNKSVFVYCQKTVKKRDDELSRE